MFESYLGRKNEANSNIVKSLCFLYLMRYRKAKLGTSRKYPLRSIVLKIKNNVALQCVMIGRLHPGKTPRIVKDDMQAPSKVEFAQHQSSPFIKYCIAQ